MESDSSLGVSEFSPLELDEKAEKSSNKATSTTTTTSSSSWLSLLTLDYYQSYFDVSTSQVLERILAGMIPVRYKLVDSLGVNPDLYGPFWLAITLILSIAISGNIANVLQNRREWEFQFHEVTVIGCCVYTYTWIVPCCLWCLLWWRSNQFRYTLLQLLAIYGYSIAIFIPLMVLWLIQNEIIRWLLWALSTLSSGSVLVVSLWRPFSQENSKMAVATLVVVIILHAGLSASFKLYYFNSALAPPTSLLMDKNSTII